ncbi:putative GTP-binding protein 6 [Lineus longissimus]|uniref:putative GTP-binding protein 6 n=1 Tax=Lineus longissimus TaxID=88925 RepID=UPI002B4C3275
MMMSLKSGRQLVTVVKWLSNYLSSAPRRNKTNLIDHRCMSSLAEKWNTPSTRMCSEPATICTSSGISYRRYSETSGNKDDYDDEAIEDERYNEYVGDQLGYLLPEGGHRVLVVQPDIKWGPRKPRLTNAALQLAEGCALIKTLPKWQVVDKLTMSLKLEDKKHVFGKGNFATLTKKVRSATHLTAVFMNVNMLTYPQLKTLQNAWKVAVYDRYTIVLQIFKVHARTREAKLQVALAELPYFKSRLQGMHDGSLEWQQQDVSRIGGMGESYIQLRQQILQERELKIKKALSKLRSKRQLLREGRLKKDIPVVAIVGYTNAGKTSLIKALTGEVEMEPKDQLFATLDVTAHAGYLASRLKVIFLDTVGFISDIPTDLIEAFAATLEDVLHADAVVHIRDISHPDTISQRERVIQTLAGLNLPLNILDNMIEACNKCDLVKSDIDTSDANLADNTVVISVTEGTGLTRLRKMIETAVLKSTGRQVKKLRIPMNGEHLGWLYKETTVCSSRASEDGQYLYVECIMNEASYARFKANFVRRKS